MTFILGVKMTTTSKFIHLKSCNLYHNVKNEDSGASLLEPLIRVITSDQDNTSDPPSSPTRVQSKRSWAERMEEDEMRAELGELKKKQKILSKELKRRREEREGRNIKKGNEILKELSLSIEHLLRSVPILQKRKMYKGGRMCL